MVDASAHPGSVAARATGPSAVLNTGFTPDPGARTPRVAFAHDWLVARRGGEFVLDALVRAASSIAQPTRVYTMFVRAEHDRVPIGESVDALPVTRSALSRLPRGARRWLLPLYPWAVGRLSRRLRRDHARASIDLLISTSSAAVKAMRAPAGVPHLCYCHSPARYVWSRAGDYRAGAGLGDRLRGLGLRSVAGAYRDWDQRTARDGRVTRMLANSTYTAEQIERDYGVPASVLHPPVRTSLFTPDPGTARAEHWLVVSALEPYKRVDLAIRAAAHAGAELEIVGTGSDEPRLRRLAEHSGARVRWLGRLDDAGVRDAYRRARVLLFPQVEDFGIVAVEALACGTPVCARRSGGALDIVGERCGAFFDHAGDDPSNDRAAAVSLAEGAARAIREHDPDSCRAQAERFSEAVFHDRACAIIAEMLGLHPARASGEA